MSEIPPAEQAHQVPPPTGALQRSLYWLVGPSYRTTIAGAATGVSVLAGGIIQYCPKLLTGRIDKHELTMFGVTILAAGGITKLGHSAKDKSATGVER